jgi:hypothetical protein
LQHLKLKGQQPKTIDAYARGIRRMGEYFDHQIDNLSGAQLSDYFSDLIASHSWSAVKLDLYAFKCQNAAVFSGEQASQLGFLLGAIGNHSDWERGWHLKANLVCFFLGETATKLNELSS